MKPIRIQRKRTKGWKMPPNTVYVGRPTFWGNPIPKNNPDWENMYRTHLLFLVHSGFHPKIELKGKNLACWCKLNESCHADILLKIANNY